MFFRELHSRNGNKKMTENAENSDPRLRHLRTARAVSRTRAELYLRIVCPNDTPNLTPPYRKLPRRRVLLCACRALVLRLPRRLVQPARQPRGEREERERASDTNANTRNCCAFSCSRSDAENTTPCTTGETMRPSAAQDVAAPLTRALTLFRHELFTAMITVVNSTASVTIFSVCGREARTTSPPAFRTTPRALATGRGARRTRTPKTLF